MGSKIGIQFVENGSLQLSIDGVKEEEVLPGVFISNQPVYAFFDLYGQCQQVRCKFLWRLLLWTYICCR